MAVLLQFAAQLLVVVDLAVEDDHGIAVCGVDGLVARCQIDDFQARGGQRNQVRFENALLVGSAVDNRRSGFPDPLRMGSITKMGKACDSAQNPLPLCARGGTPRLALDKARVSFNLSDAIFRVS